MNVSSHSKICRVDDFVGRWVVKNGLGVNTGLVGKCAESSNVVVETTFVSRFRSKLFCLNLRDVNFNCLSNKILNILKLMQLVLAHNILSVCDNHACH